MLDQAEDCGVAEGGFVEGLEEVYTCSFGRQFGCYLEVLLTRLLTKQDGQERQIYLSQYSHVVFGSDEYLIVIWRVGFEELRRFVAVGLFVNGGISFDSSYFDCFGWVVGRFSRSILELDVILV